VWRRHRGGSLATAPEAAHLTGEDEYSSSPVSSVHPSQFCFCREKGESLSIEREIEKGYEKKKTGPLLL